MICFNKIVFLIPFLNDPTKTAHFSETKPSAPRAGNISHDVNERLTASEREKRLEMRSSNIIFEI